MYEYLRLYYIFKKNLLAGCRILMPERLLLIQFRFVNQPFGDCLSSTGRLVGPFDMGQPMSRMQAGRGKLKVGNRS
jgi:hypothetical protein